MYFTCESLAQDILPTYTNFAFGSKIENFELFQKNVNPAVVATCHLCVTNSSSHSLGPRIKSRLGHGYVDVICNIITGKYNRN